MRSSAGPPGGGAPGERSVPEAQRHFREGLLYGLAAYGWWGLVPLYFDAVRTVPPREVLAHRVVWSVLFLALLLTLAGRWPELRRCFRSPRVLTALAVSAALIAVNWFVYIYSVVTRQITQASLGYFITPLVSVLLGLVFFRERLRPWQWLAVGLVAGGVGLMTLAADTFPWIALCLAFSFGFYGLLRKTLPVDGVVGLAVETLLLLPPAVGYLIYLGREGQLTLGSRGVGLDALLALGGVVTTVPLVCFVQAARRLPLSTLGFLQYLSPTLQLVLAVTLYGEAMGPDRLGSFVLIWTALGLFTWDSVRAYQKEIVAEEA